MHPQLLRLHASYAELLSGCSAEVLESRPGSRPACWNARQIVEHLVLTYRSSSTVFRERVAKGRPTLSKPKPLQLFQQLFVCRFGFFRSGLPAPDNVVPAATMGPLDGDTLGGCLYDELKSMDDLLIACKQQFGEQRFATHQVLGAMSANQWRRFHVAHGFHHLKQIRLLLSEPSSLTKEAEIPAQN